MKDGHPSSAIYNIRGLFTLFSIIRKKVISSKVKINARVYDVPTSANLIDAKKQIMTKQSHQNNLMIVPTQ